MVPILRDNCQIQYFFMDTKRNKSEKFAQLKAQQVLKLINEYQPDVLIAADDNASRFLVMPYLKNANLPVVFCGINNSTQPYGYPYQNATGMVEITPVSPLLIVIQKFLPNANSGVFLSADVLSQRRMYTRLKEIFSKNNILLEGHFVSSQDAWEKAWGDAQQSDFIFIGNPAGINTWDKSRNRRFIKKHSNTLTLTAWEWAAPNAMITITKIPEEQGEWAAKVTLAILKGMSPQQIPVVANRRWKMFFNRELLLQGGFSLPIEISHNAQEVK